MKHFAIITVLAIFGCASAQLTALTPGGLAALAMLPPLISYINSPLMIPPPLPPIVPGPGPVIPPVGPPAFFPGAGLFGPAYYPGAPVIVERRYRYSRY